MGPLQCSNLVPGLLVYKLNHSKGIQLLETSSTAKNSQFHPVKAASAATTGHAAAHGTHPDTSNSGSSSLQSGYNTQSSSPAHMCVQQPVQHEQQQQLLLLQQCGKLQAGCTSATPQLQQQQQQTPQQCDKLPVGCASAPPQQSGAEVPAAASRIPKAPGYVAAGAAADATAPKRSSSSSSKLGGRLHNSSCDTMPFVSAATRHTREVSGSGAKLPGSNHQQQQQQQQQQRFERRQLSPSKRPQSPSILAAVSPLPPVNAAAAAAAAHPPRKAISSTHCSYHSSGSSSTTSSSSSTHSSSPAGPVPGPQLVQHLQLPSSVKAMLALPHSMSQQRFRERQRMELYALNAIMGM
jgi:hypothetical protein